MYIFIHLMQNRLATYLKHELFRYFFQKCIYGRNMMSKKITIDISDEIYEFLKIKADESETIEMVAATYLEEGINLEKTLRQ